MTTTGKNTLRDVMNLAWHFGVLITVKSCSPYGLTKTE